MVHKFAFISFSERQRPRPCQYIDSILSCHFRVLGAFPLAIVFLLWRIQLAANGCWRASGHFLVFTICANSRSITILSPSSPTSDNLKKRAKKGCKSNQQLQVTTRLTSFNIQFIVCDQLLHVVPNCQLINSSVKPMPFVSASSPLGGFPSNNSWTRKGRVQGLRRRLLRCGSSQIKSREQKFHTRNKTQMRPPLFTFVVVCFFLLFCCVPATVKRGGRAVEAGLGHGPIVTDGFLVIRSFSDGKC